MTLLGAELSTSAVRHAQSRVHGGRPSLRSADSWDKELDLVVEHVQTWHDIPRESVAAAKITGHGARGVEGVHVGTMYRFKGLEYRCMIIAGVAQGLVPRPAVDTWERTDRLRHRRELQ